MPKEDFTTIKNGTLLYTGITLLFFISWYDTDLFVTISGVLLSIGIIAVAAAWAYNLR